MLVIFSVFNSGKPFFVEFGLIKDLFILLSPLASSVRDLSTNVSKLHVNAKRKQQAPGQINIFAN
jgi:hypothetical protein